MLSKYRERHADIKLSISATTRNSRPKEIDGKDYLFVSEQEFKENIKKGNFLEWAELYGNFYGTFAEYVENYLEQGIDVYLEIDVQGAKQVKNKKPDSVLIFIMPPSIEELERRLEGRKTETRKDLEKRITVARDELGEVSSYDYQINNVELNKTVDELESIIRSVKKKDVIS